MKFPEFANRPQQERVITRNNGVSFHEHTSINRLPCLDRNGHNARRWYSGRGGARLSERSPAFHRVHTTPAAPEPATPGQTKNSTPTAHHPPDCSHSNCEWLQRHSDRRTGTPHREPPREHDAENT